MSGERVKKQVDAEAWEGNMAQSKPGGLPAGGRLQMGLMHRDDGEDGKRAHEGCKPGESCSSLRFSRPSPVLGVSNALSSPSGGFDHHCLQG